MARVDEAIAGLQRSFEQARDARPAWLQEVDESLTSIGKRLGVVADRFAPLSGSIEKLASHLTALREAQEEISASLAQEAGRRREDEARRRGEEAMALNSRGVSLYYSGALEAAEAAFRSALELKPDFAEASNNLGLALSRQGRDAEAEACFSKALELEPAMAEAMNNLGFLLHQGMKFEKAVEMFSRSALTGEDSSIAWTNMGNACYKMGKYTDAVEAWKKAVAADPHQRGGA